MIMREVEVSASVRAGDDRDRRIQREGRQVRTVRKVRRVKTRKNLSCLLFAALAGCLSPAAGADKGNLVINPDFESSIPGQGAPGWNTWQKLGGSEFHIVVDPRIAHAGSRCAAIEQAVSNQRNHAVWFQELPAEALTTYRFSFWIKTDNVRPLTPYNETWPLCCGSVGFLDSERKELPDYPQSASVFMTHDWQKLEISFTTPHETAFIKINLALGNAVGKVYFDSVSLVVSLFQKITSPHWLVDSVVYEIGPWEYSRSGSGRAFDGIAARLPELETLGVNLLYLLPVWEDSGWYDITDHFALFRKYGTESELGALVDDAHRRGMKVILDLAGTLGVPAASRLVKEHPEWFIRGGDNRLYRSWMDLYGLDVNRPDVQQYFIEVANHYIERLNIDGYRCDSAMALPCALFQEIRHAIQQIRPEAILIAEGSAPIDHETAFDATYDFPFLDRISSLFSNPHDAGKTVRWLEAQRDFYPPGALQLRYLEGHDLNYTIASKSGLKGSRAFAALLFTIDGIPMIYNGQEVGNREPQIGWWKPPIDWDGNPNAALYREAYGALTHIRARYPVLRRGSLTALTSSDDRVAAFSRTLSGEQTILTIISFSDATLETRLDLSAATLGVSKGCILEDLLDESRFTVADPGTFSLTLEPYQPRIFLLLPRTEIGR